MTLKKILSLLLLSFILITLVGCDKMSDEEFASKKSSLNQRISELQSEINDKNETLNSKKSEYESALENTDLYLSEDEIDAFYSKCNIYLARSVVTISVAKRQMFSHSTTANFGSGVVVLTQDGYSYLLTSYSLISLSNAVITIMDAFGSTYQGQLTYYSADSNLAIVRFKNDGSNDLYDCPVSSYEAKEDDDVASIMTTDDGMENHIQIKRIKETNSEKCSIDSDMVKYAIGSPLLCVNGSLVGICDSVDGTTLSYTGTDTIRSFMSDAGFTFE